MLFFTGQQSLSRHQLRRCLRRYVGRARGHSLSLFGIDVQDGVQELYATSLFVNCLSLDPSPYQALGQRGS